jgi:ubiquinone/menaquinone biosynthesis C-methylase UbiE
MNKQNDYDFIASDYYHNIEERDDRPAVLIPSARHYLGDVKGKKVLDLACGNGYYSRLIKSWGARKVVGVDISEPMINLAKLAEENLRQGIEYYLADATTLPKLEQFDVIFAGFLLHYSTSVENLHTMCEHIASQLKGGGRFVSFCENPKHPTGELKYDAEAIAVGPIKDGSRIQRFHYSKGVRALEFSHQHYEEATYEHALKAAGFHDIEWHPFILGEVVNPEYWADFIRDDFTVIVMTCVKDE